MTAVTATGLAAAAGAAALHVLIFYLESFAWEGPLARTVFGGSPEEARSHAFYAYNQGFYNLFLAIEVFLGMALMPLGGGASRVGAVLVVYGVGSMLAAAIVLALKSSAHRGAAAKQGALPALAVVCLVLGLFVL